MRLAQVLVVILACTFASAGCGGVGGTTFTNANWGDLQSNVGRYKPMLNRSPVDFVGQAFLVEGNEPGAIWVSVYVDWKNANYRTLVKVPDASFTVANHEFIHVVGTVRQDIGTPDVLMWYGGPVILASEATVVPQPSG